MKVKIPLGLLVVLAAALGYLLGTESGRQKRDVILVKAGRKEAASADADAPESDAAEPGDA